MINIEQELTHAMKISADISEHLLYIANLTRNCGSVLECGVRSVVSSWAFVNGLHSSNSTTKRLLSCDLDYAPRIETVRTACAERGIKFDFFQGNDLDIPMEEFDLIFIDTWHVYGHLKRELAKMHSFAKKYIVMHDTEVDKVDGESIRCGFNIPQQVISSGYPEHEIRCGLGKALDEFLAAHPEWKVKEHFTHQYGLTVLERV